MLNNFNFGKSNDESFRDGSENGIYEMPDSKKYHYSYEEWRPTNIKETLLYNHDHGQVGRDSRYKVYVDNPPQWNPKTNTYVYDFRGRVSEASIKNF